MIGTRFGHFRVEGKLGQGGMGAVYRARDEKLHRMVALKLLPTEWAADPTARARLLREARAAASLTHRNVATVYEVGEAADQIFLAMELIDGLSLRAMLAGSQPPLNERLRIATGIVRGVTKAHEKGIVHRDLKPENVMLTEDGEVKVLDFGLARQIDELDAVGPTRPVVEAVTKTGQILGTPAYMSPEQATGQPLDVRSDVFSLGIILYELTTGRHPFPANGPLAVAVAIVQDEPARASTVNAEVTPVLDHIIATCLAKGPRERYSSAGDLLRDLERLTKEASSTPMTPSGAPAAPRRRRALFAGVAAAVFAIAGVTLWFQRARRDARGGGQPAVASVDRSPLTSANPEVARLIAVARQAEQTNRGQSAVDTYTRIFELDPKVGAPLMLRMALSGRASNGQIRDWHREQFRRVLDARASLDERDQAWLDAWEPVMQRQPADEAETVRRLRAALARFPNDDEIAGDLADLICNSPDSSPEARVAEAKAAGLGGKRLAAVVDCANADLGADEAVLTGRDTCGQTPADLSCLWDRGGRLMHQGDCTELEAVARRMMTIERDGFGVFYLASALLGQRGQEESAREVLRAWTARQEGSRRAERMLWGEITIAISKGDFTTAIERIRALDDFVKDQREEKNRQSPARHLAAVFEEIGRPKDAAEVARSFLARRAAYEPSPTRNKRSVEQDPTGILLGIERRAGRLSTEQYREQLQARLDWWDRRLGTTSWLRYSVWQAQYAEAAQTPAEAKDALAAQPRFGGPYKADLTSLGRTHLLAGMVDQALPELEKDTKGCPFIFSDRLPEIRSWFFLGEARAAKGDRPGACAAYGRLLEYWGAAKPRSLTAEKARRRRQELRCSS